ncbi:MAG: hypothetical protein IRZ16_15990 [Myxococcaceae bacterium]|nr:hypothetical protein [Myxococcaceae bacterium]
MRRFLAVLALGCAAACSPPPPSGADGGDDGGGAVDGGHEQQAPYAFYGLTGAGDFLPLDLAIAEDGRVGVAYFVNVGKPMGANDIDYEIRYQEWKDGQLSEPETVHTVQRLLDVSLTFAPNGQPAIGYLGGDAVTPVGVSQYWLQSDAAVAWREPNGTWTEEIVAQHSADAAGSKPDGDIGFLVGLGTQLVSAGGKTFVAWRDCHFGQNTSDWSGSELEFASGGRNAWQPSVVVSGWDGKQGYGGHLDMVIADGEPAIVSDSVYGGADSAGQNLYFSRRKKDGTWAPIVAPTNKPIGDTQSGPSLAYDPVLGFAIAVVDRTEDALYFTRSQPKDDGKAGTWSELTPVYQSGSGGWYPSLSINPITHEPSIAYYVCSKAPGANEGSCVEEDDELRISERIAGIWRTQQVDPAGGWHPKLAHFANGKRVLAYRDPRSGAIKLAVEK